MTLDVPGKGLSPTSRHALTLIDAADAVDWLVQALDLDDITLVVHDLGGPAALEAAARWESRVSRLVIINVFGWQPSAASRGACRGAPPVELAAAWLVGQAWGVTGPDSAAVAAVFDRAAASYDDAIPYFSRFGDRLVELVQVGPGDQVLDVACGRGASLIPANHLASRSLEVASESCCRSHRLR